MTVSDPSAAPGYIASAIAKLISGLASIVTYVRAFATWFKANYWHAFVTGIAVAWLALVSHDIGAHPLTWLAWWKQPAAQSALSLPAEPATIAVDPNVDPVASVKPKPATKSRSKAKKAAQLSVGGVELGNFKF